MSKPIPDNDTLTRRRIRLEHALCQELTDEELRKALDAGVDLRRLWDEGCLNPRHEKRHAARRGGDPC
jgi:hypothetical protein